MTQVVDLRLLPAAAAAWGVAFLLVGQDAGTALWTALVSAVLLGVLVGVAVAGRRRREISLVTTRERHTGTKPAGPLTATKSRLVSSFGQAMFVLLVLLVTSLITAAHLAAASSDVLARSSAAGSEVEVLARVTSDPRPVASWGGEEQFLVTLTTLTVQSNELNEAQQAEAHLVLFADSRWQQVRYGSIVRTGGRVVPADAPGAREQFRLVQQGRPEVVEAPSALLDPFQHARNGLVKATQHLSPQARGLVPGVGVGDRSHLSPDLARAMRVTGLTHITAVSGSHFAIIAMATLVVSSLLRLPRVLRIVVSAVVMCGFVFLVRPEPSVARAALMGGFALAGMSMGRPARALTALAVAVIALLLADPWLARAYGFILSVLATAGLVLWAGPLTRFLSRWLPQWLALVIAVPAVAQAVCGPVVILLEPNFATYAVPANVLATPALAPAALCSVSAAVLSTCWPAGAAILATCASWATSWIAGVATFFANLPGAYPPWPVGARGALLLAGVTAAAVLVVLATPYLRHAVCSAVQARRRPWLRPGSSFSTESWDS